jgi:hypothetical protein
MALLRSFLVPVPLGVIAATLIAASISGDGLRLIFAIIALAVGLRLAFNRDSWRLGAEIPENPWRAATGFVIGLLSALMGIGGGVMNNTFMTLFGRPMHQAVATSAGVGVLIAIPGTIGYVWAGWGDPRLPVASTGYVNWIAVALILPITLLVTPFGVTLAHAMKKRAPGNRLRRVPALRLGPVLLEPLRLIGGQSRRIITSRRTSKPDSEPMKFMPSRLWPSASGAATSTGIRRRTIDPTPISSTVARAARATPLAVEMGIA